MRERHLGSRKPNLGLKIENSLKRLRELRLKNPWNTIDRWGPGIISLISILALVYYGWINDQRVARLEGMVQARLHMEGSLRMEVQTWQAYVSSLEKVMIEHGLQVPERPKPIKSGPTKSGRK